MDPVVRLTISRMQKLWLIALFLGAPLACRCYSPDDPPTAEETANLNVNSRYTVESVQIVDAKGSKQDPKLSDTLRADLYHVVGEKLDHSHLEELAQRLKKELHAAKVSVNVDKGTTPEHVVVNFETRPQRDRDFDLDVVKFVYHSRQGWSGEGNLTTTVHGNAFLFGLVSDDDALTERFAGIRAGFERKNMGTERLKLRFIFSSFHEQWNRATLENASPSLIYRTRQSFAPEATIVIVRPLELSFGADFARYRPDVAGAKTESSNAVVSTLRYHQRWGSDKNEQDVRANYSIRAATGVLESDRIFARHEVGAHYRMRKGDAQFDAIFSGGRIAGFAPLYERFVLGNAHTLRGWNKFDLDPLGASHAAHGSLEFSYDGFLVFYDTGAIWDRPVQREQKHSLGVGFRSKDGFQLAVAFPVKSGSVDPVFYAGVGF